MVLAKCLAGWALCREIRALVLAATVLFAVVSAVDEIDTVSQDAGSEAPSFRVAFEGNRGRRPSPRRSSLRPVCLQWPPSR